MIICEQCDHYYVCADKQANNGCLGECPNFKIDIHNFIAKADEGTLFQLKKEIESALTKIAEREAYEEARREAMRLDEADGTLKGRGYA